MARRSAAVVRRKRTDKDESSAVPDMPLFGTVGNSTVSDFGKPTELRVVGDDLSSDHRDASVEFGEAARSEGAAAPVKKRRGKPSKTAFAEELPTPVASGIGEGGRALKRVFLARKLGRPRRVIPSGKSGTNFKRWFFGNDYRHRCFRTCKRLPTSPVSGPVMQSSPRTGERCVFRRDHCQ